TLDRQEEGLWRATLQIRDGQGANPTRGTGYELEILPGHWVHLGVSFDHEARSATFFWNGEVKTVVQIPASVQPGSEVFILGERRTSNYVSEFRGAIDDFFITEGLHEFAPLEGGAP